MENAKENYDAISSAKKTNFIGNINTEIFIYLCKNVFKMPAVHIESCLRVLWNAVEYIAAAWFPKKYLQHEHEQQSPFLL